MSPVQWYYARGNQQAGPVSLAELKRMASSGELSPDDLIWRDGMKDWAPARNANLFEDLPTAVTPPAAVPPAAAPAPPKSAQPAARGSEPASAVPQVGAVMPGVPGPTALDRAPPPTVRHLFDVLLEFFRAQFPAHLIESTAKIFIVGGHYTLYAAMLGCFAFAMILGIKTRLLDPVLSGLIAVLILAVLQYAARLFCGALDRLNRTTSSTISSTAFPDCFALLNMVAGLAVLLTSAVLAIRSEEYSLILFGLVVFIVCEYLAFVSLSPGALNISVAPAARAGEEAIGVLSFLVKAILQLVPVAFGAGVVYGTIRLFYACYLLFTEGGAAGGVPVDLPLGFAVTGSAAVAVAYRATYSVVYYAALPFAAYVLFLLYYLAIDVIRATLSLPAKLDKLAEKDEKGSE